MEERTRAYREGLDGPAQALGEVRPAIVLLAHTASSYALGWGREQPLVDRVASLCRAPALLAAQAVRAALHHLGVTRLALGTPYPESISRQGRAYWEAAGFRARRLSPPRGRGRYLRRRPRSARPSSRARPTRPRRRRC